jgi:hypothetical protein
MYTPHYVTSTDTLVQYTVHKRYDCTCETKTLQSRESYGGVAVCVQRHACITFTAYSKHRTGTVCSGSTASCCLVCPDRCTTFELRQIQGRHRYESCSYSTRPGESVTILHAERHKCNTPQFGKGYSIGHHPKLGDYRKRDGTAHECELRRDGGERTHQAPQWWWHESRKAPDSGLFAIRVFCSRDVILSPICWTGSPLKRTWPVCHASYCDCIAKTGCLTAIWCVVGRNKK